MLRPPTTTGRRSRKLRVRSLLLLVVLIPTLGMTAMAVSTADGAISKRDAAQQVQSKAETLAIIIDARLAIEGEETESAVQAVASDLGIDVTRLSTLYGVDYRARMVEARAVVDADATIRALPELAGERRRLQSLRAKIDAGTATYAAVRQSFDGFTSKLDRAWRSRVVALQDELKAEELAGVLHTRVDNLEDTFDALSWSGRRAGAAVVLLREGLDPDELVSMLEAGTRFRTATDAFAGQLGPQAAVAWRSWRTDAASRRFNRTLAAVGRAFLTGTSSPLASDPAAFGVAFNDGTPWASGLTRVVGAAATDLQIEATHQERMASTELRNGVVAAALLTILALAGALVLARSLGRPVRRLQDAARQVHDGHFDLGPIATGGPRELSETASAFNEMATTLAAVEAHAVALVDDPSAPLLNDELPGRTGRALQVALNRLRASIRGADEHRRELEHAATHDGLTGLVNRSAALTMIERELAQAARAGALVMVLFVDLDGLKVINDGHGHAAGDEALRRTAQALRASTRLSDIVARLGGDEFLVASVTTDGSDVEQLAERIRFSVAAPGAGATGGQLSLHCSIGMAVSGPGIETVDALIHRADSALYRAKRQGRNQVAWADPVDVLEPGLVAPTSP